MHRVRRAIIMAAGIGKRLQPITLSTPKPLVSVNGVRMIDTIIRGLKKNGIQEIYVVVGYLKEQFYGLEKEYGVHLLENPFYDTCNNISSLYMAREYIEDAMILDGDQIIRNEKILTPEFDKSGYHAVWNEGQTDEWLMQVNEGKVISCSRTGGRCGWQLYSISRWTAEDGRKLRSHLEEEFVYKQNRQIYWDDIVMFEHFGEYELGIFPMDSEDVIEIDDYSELVALDKSYMRGKNNE